LYFNFTINTSISPRSSITAQKSHGYDIFSSHNAYPFSAGLSDCTPLYCITMIRRRCSAYSPLNDNLANCLALMNFAANYPILISQTVGNESSANSLFSLTVTAAFIMHLSIYRPMS